jgi:hypothetical protein
MKPNMTEEAVMTREAYNKKMFSYIWNVFQHSIIPFSWGFSHTRVIDGGTEFHVQGFKVTGSVKVQYIDGLDLFKVTITPDSDQEHPITFDDVYIDQLITIIDDAVEKVDDYAKAVRAEYELTS